MNKGLQALKKIKKGGREDDDFGWLSNSYLYEEEIATIEKELKAKANLVSMCENLAKLVGLKEKDYVELENLITKKLKRLEQLDVMYSNCVIEGAKQKKTLAIIRKTISTDLHFDYEEDTERWYVWIDCEGYQVYIFEGQGKEEYDLLKEVLL